jgi:hypothetical protein
MENIRHLIRERQRRNREVLLHRTRGGNELIFHPGQSLEDVLGG